VEGGVTLMFTFQSKTTKYLQLNISVRIQKQRKRLIKILLKDRIRLMVIFLMKIMWP